MDFDALLLSELVAEVRVRTGREPSNFVGSRRVVYAFWVVLYCVNDEVVITKRQSLHLEWDVIAVWSVSDPGLVDGVVGRLAELLGCAQT